MTDREQDRGNDEEDARCEALVLRRALDLHPAQASIEELARDVGEDPAEFAGRDAVERAVHDLARAGLMHRSGEFAFPTLAALRFDELLG